MSHALEELATAALLGTERRPPRAPAVPAGAGALDAALTAQPWDEDPAAAVLAAAALVSAHARGGVAAARLGPEAGAEDSAAAPQAARPAPPAVAVLLPRLAADADGLAHLPELLERLAARGEHVPPTSLPALLDLGRAHRALRPLVLRAGDRRAAWLAAHRPEWSWAADAPGPGADPTAGDARAAGAWRTGSTEARAVLLAELRAADPAAARELVASTWDEDPPEARARFLATLRPGLGPDDEPLLERALDDRRKEVRTAAAELLSSLPGSGLQRRNAERLAALVAIGARKLEVRLPELPLDKAAQRDRVGASGRAPAAGARAAALADLVAGAGLAFWPEPAKALKLAAHTDFAGALADGWRRAASAAGDPAWLTALAEQYKDITLLASLAPEEADRVAVRLTRDEDVALSVAVLPGPWSHELSQAVLRRGARRPDHLDRPALRVIATRLHPGTLSDATALFTDLGAADLLDLRQTLIRELPLP